MGELNSSKTRVVPVFKQLLASDASGASWLPKLIALGSRADEVPAPPAPHRLIPQHPATWGQDECSLPAPKALLRHLVQIVTPEQVTASGAKGETRTKREALTRRDDLAGGLQGVRVGVAAGVRGIRASRTVDSTRVKTLPHKGLGSLWA